MGFLYGAFFVSDLREKTFSFPNIDCSPHSITLPLVFPEEPHKGNTRKRLRWVAEHLVTMYGVFRQPFELWQSEFRALDANHLRSRIQQRLTKHDDRGHVLRPVFADPSRFAGLLAGTVSPDEGVDVLDDLFSGFLVAEEDELVRLTALVVVLGHLLTYVIHAFFSQKPSEPSELPWSVDCFLNGMVGTTTLEKRLSCIYVEPGEVAWGILSRIRSSKEDGAEGSRAFDDRMRAYELSPVGGGLGRTAEDVVSWLRKVLIVMPEDYADVLTRYITCPSGAASGWEERIGELEAALVGGDAKAVCSALDRFQPAHESGYRFNVPLQLVLKHRDWGDWAFGYRRGYLFVPCSTVQLEAGDCDEFSVASLNIDAQFLEERFRKQADPNGNGLLSTRDEYATLLRSTVGDLSLFCAVLHGAADYERRRAIVIQAGRTAERFLMSNLLLVRSNHDLGTLQTQVGGGVTSLLDEWDRRSDAEKREDLEEVLANTQLAFLGAELDLPWVESGRPLDMESISHLKSLLEPAVRFRGVRVAFHGDWDKTTEVPKALRVVFSNLIRNAIDMVGNEEVVLEARVCETAAEFICRSQRPMVAFFRHQAFIGPLSPKPPLEHRGLWICRRFVVDLCQGEWSLAEETDKFQTNIRVCVPLGLGSRQK